MADYDAIYDLVASSWKAGSIVYLIALYYDVKLSRDYSFIVHFTIKLNES